MEDIAVILKAKAESFNACKKGLRKLPSTPQGLIKRWKENIDFAINNNFPTTEEIKEYFERGLLHKNLVYVDEHISLVNAPNGVYVLNGECSGTLHFNSWAVATIYVRHTSKVYVIAEDFAKVFVRLYDDAEVDITTIGDAEIKMYNRK